MSSKIVKKFGADRLIRYAMGYAGLIALIVGYDWAHDPKRGPLVLWLFMYLLSMAFSALIAVVLGLLFEAILDGED